MSTVSFASIVLVGVGSPAVLLALNTAYAVIYYPVLAG